MIYRSGNRPSNGSDANISSSLSLPPFSTVAWNCEAARLDEASA